jgi:hypothetical protein
MYLTRTENTFPEIKSLFRSTKKEESGELLGRVQVLGSVDELMEGREEQQQAGNSYLPRSGKCVRWETT